MALKIRLRQQGKKNAQVYRLVLTESRNPRDGKYIEALGWYNPFASQEEGIHVQAERVQYWLDQGAIVTERAKGLIKKSCPAVINAYNQKLQARAAKKCAKRRELKKAAA